MADEREFLVVGVSETNFDVVEFRDNHAQRPRWRRACSRLRNGFCTKRLRYRGTTPNLDVRILDEAGNSALASI